VLGSVKMFLNGAGVLPQETRAMFERIAGAKIVEGYGLSEASPMVSVCTPAKWKEGSIGTPAPDTDVRIVDIETGEDLPRGKEGEIVVRGPQIMMGYWQKPEETAQILRNGRLYTGDVGYQDEEDFLFITDRLKDMAKINGENVFPAKVEAALCQQELVAAAAVVGVPDAQEGERLVACIVLARTVPDASEARRAILRSISAMLASHEIPSDVRFLESLDAYKNALGKVLKRKIREAIGRGELTS